MSVQKVLIGGAVLAVAVYVFTVALHLLNEASDLAVVAGYTILLLMLAGLVGAYTRYRKSKSAKNVARS